MQQGVNARTHIPCKQPQPLPELVLLSLTPQARGQFALPEVAEDLRDVQHASAKIPSTLKFRT